MNEELLHAYLSDHLSATNEAIELAIQCRTASAHPRLTHFLESFIPELRADLRTLQAIRSRIRGRRHPIAGCLRWLVEQVGSLRFGLDHFRSDDLGRLEQLEALLLAARANLVLWQLLAKLDDPRMREIDFSRLTRRAERQLAAVERHYLAVATTIIGAGDTQLQLRLRSAT